MWLEFQRVAAPTMRAGRASRTEYLYWLYADGSSADCEFPQGLQVHVDVFCRRSNCPAAHTLKVGAPACPDVISITEQGVRTDCRIFYRGRYFPKSLVAVFSLLCTPQTGGWVMHLLPVPCPYTAAGVTAMSSRGCKIHEQSGCPKVQ